MKNLVIIITAAVLSLGVADAKEMCGGSDAKYYDEALQYHLSKKSVPYRTMRGGGLCVAERFTPEFEAARRQVDNYFYEIAHRLADSCEERAFSDWVTKHKLRFEIRPVVDSLKRPAGSMFFLRSFTSEEVFANKRWLENEAPKQASCAKDKR